MGTIFVQELEASTLQPGASGELTVGNASFPVSDSSSRSTASFGSVDSFVSKSTYQSVTSGTAAIDPGTTIVGVDFDGPVVLTLPDTVDARASEITIVDEGGFCSTVNTITAASPGALGSLVISSPFAHLKSRSSVSGGEWISESRDTIEIPDVVNEPGTTTVVSGDGTVTSTSADGNTTFTVSPDGTTELEVVDGAVTSTTTVLPDGTQIAAEADWSGNSSSFTTNPDGSTVQQVDSNDGSSSTFTVAPDGTTTDVQNSNNGNTSSVVVSPDGTTNTQISQNDGSSETSTVNPDGSSYSFATASNGMVTITNVGTDGVEVKEVYYPWQTTYTVTTTPPGTSTTESPNPYFV